MLLKGAFPAAPRILFGIVDVRDLAALHLIAMVHPRAAGERFIAQADELSYTLLDISLMLREGLGGGAARAPRDEISDKRIHELAKFLPNLTVITNRSSNRPPATPAKAKSLLHWRPRSAFETIVDTGQSLLDLSHMQDRR